MIPGVSMRPDGGSYVFVSYASVDRERVLGVANALMGAGVGVWLDQADIPGGSSYGPEIAAGIQGCGAVTLMCSAASLASRNVRQEIQLAWRYGRPILPLLLEPVTFPDDLSYWLEGAQWIEVLQRTPEEWLPAALRALAIVGVVEAPASSRTGPAGPVAVAPAPAVGNLPVLGGLVGRVQEIAQVRSLAANNRLVTLTGPGGTGKTRLAVEVALRLAEGFPDGAWLVELAAETDSALVPAAILATLGGQAEPGESDLDALTRHLAASTTLLILDNLEQLTGIGAILERLLDACPGLTVLATSRVPLRAAGEWAFAVPPLETPDPSHLPSLPELAGNPAVRLFVDAARAARPDFALSAANAPSVAAICAHLDGLPLAIELAAARVRLLPPPALLARLGSRLNVLTRGGGSAASPRQQTMRATIAWSYDLLDAAEQTVFRRLAVFAGGCTLDAAEAVAGGQGYRPEGDKADALRHVRGTALRAEGERGREDETISPSVSPSPPQSVSFVPLSPAGLSSSVVDALDALLDHGLVRPDPSGDEEQPRVRMLETIREFALETLVAGGEESAARWAHADHFLAVAEAAVPDITGAPQTRVLSQLEADHDNLRGAFSWLNREPVDRAADQALRLGAALYRFWQVRGHLNEGRRLLETALARTPSTAVSPKVYADGLEGAGALADTQGDHERAAELHGKALAIRRESGDRRGAARSLDNLGIAAESRGDFATALALYEEALAERKEIGDERDIAISLHQLSYLALLQEELERAETLATDSLAHFRRAGDTKGVATALQNMAMLTSRRGDFGRAATLYEENLSLWRTLGDVHSIAFALVNLGRAIGLSGDPQRGMTSIEEAVPIFRDLGDTPSAAWALWALGHAWAASGDLDRAESLFAEALALNRPAGDQIGIIECLEGLGIVACSRGDAITGLPLIAAADALREEIGVPLPALQRPSYDAGLAAARAALDPATFAAAWAMGRVMSLDQAISEVAEITVPRR